MKLKYLFCLVVFVSVIAQAENNATAEEVSTVTSSPSAAVNVVTTPAKPKAHVINVLPTKVEPTYLQTSNQPVQTVNSNLDVVDQRIAYENSLANNPFLILPYMPTYLLPGYYSSSPDYQVYDGNTPDGQKVSNFDVKFQFSFMVPLWKNIMQRPTSLFFAYTQLSYWQAYNDSPFFRETNYQPELFVANYFNKHLPFGWKLKFVNAGIVHQSNGRGGDMERSWNRVYAEGIFAKGNWAVFLKPWYVIKDSSMEDHNSDITHYLGYGNTQIAYKYGEQTFGLSLQNEIESHFQRGAENFTWSFPLTTHVKGFVELFSGYGQSLIEYNHYTNAVGIGIALNDWV